MLVEDYARDPAVRQRFVSEAQTAASLDAHPNIVTVYSWGQVGGSMYFVTAFIAGISLAELIERQPGGSGLPVAEAMSLLRQTAGAIDFAHRSGAIHRDVKPANIMVKMTDTPRTAFLVDFGITKMGDGDPWTPSVSSSAPPTTPPRSRWPARRSTNAPTCTRSPARPSTC